MYCCHWSSAGKCAGGFLTVRSEAEGEFGNDREGTPREVLCNNFVNPTPQNVSDMIMDVIEAFNANGGNDQQQCNIAVVSLFGQECTYHM